MTNRLLATILVGVLCIQLYGQNKFIPEWNIGVGFGPTVASMSIVPTNQSNSLDVKSISQLHGGISARYISEKNLGFIAELNYSQAGWESKYDVDNGYKHIHKLNYIELPFMTHIYFGSKKIRGFVNIGPKVQYLISEKETLNDKLQAWLTNEKPDPIVNEIAQYNKKADRNFDYGLVAGLGGELRTAIGNFSLEGRYYMGFGDIYNSRKSDDFSRSAHRIMSVRLTYYIKPFFKKPK
ncbi:MAG: hypothetical protein RL662_1969 [Bacteroidota bacterium]|jgi:hypothetical protein